jgi:hypothetical protein
MMNEYNNPTLLSCMFSNLFPFGISILDMPNRPIKVSLQMHTKHLMNLNDTQYNFSKHHLFSFFGFNITQQRQICLKAKLTMSRSSNMNEKENLNKLQSTYFDEIVKNPQDINGNTNVNSLSQHIKVSNKYVMTSRNNRTTQSNI